MTLEIFDTSGKLVRRYSSAERMPPIDAKQLDIPAAWVHPPEPLSAAAGVHRFVWDLHYPRRGRRTARRIGRVGCDVWFRRRPVGASRRLHCEIDRGRQSYSQPLTVKMDPRLKVSQADLQKQFDFTQQVLARTAEVNAASQQAAALQKRLQEIAPQIASRKELANSVDELDKRTSALLGKPPAGELGGTPEPTDRTTLRYVSGALGQVERVVESDDAAPYGGCVRCLCAGRSNRASGACQMGSDRLYRFAGAQQGTPSREDRAYELGMQRPAAAEN